MGGAAPDMAGRKQLRSRYSAMMKIQSGDEEEEKKMRGGASEVRNKNTSTAVFLEEGKKKEGGTNNNKNMMANDQEKIEKTTIWNGHNKMKSRKNSAIAFLKKVKKKEKLFNVNSKKKMQIGDDEDGKNRCNSDHKLKSRKESTTLSEKETNKEKLNKTHRVKMWAADSKERKILSGHNKVKSGEMSTAFFGKEKKGKRLNKTNNEELQSDGDEEEMWNYDSKARNGKVTAAFSEEEKKKKRPNNTNTEKETAPITPAVKEKRMRLSESTEMMMCHDKLKRNAPSNLSKEKKMDISSGSNYKKRKREEPHTLFKKEKRMRCIDSDKKIHSGRVQEKKICGDGEEKNMQAPFAFFKFVCHNFMEILLIPPAIAPRLKYLTNRHVYLKDSEGTCSKVWLSKMDGSLAFHQGWNIFVSDHMIKWGEFLLFEYIDRETFSVRVFSIDSHERLYFKKDPKRVEHRVGSGPVAQDNNNESLINQQCKTKGTSPLRSKAKTVILISDSGVSTHNEDTTNLTMSDADSTHHVAINTNKDPKRVQSGVGNLPDGECGTKCISPTYSEGKTSSEIIVTDVAPLTHENDDRVGYELEVHDLDEDLIRKQGINSIPFDSITAVEKHQNHSKMNISQNVCSKYAAPGGFRCLEKWRKGIANSGAALDGTVRIEPENIQKTDSKLVDGYGSIGLNTVNEYFCSEGNHTRVPPIFTMPDKEPSSADRVSKCSYGSTEIDHSINNVKGGGASVQIERPGEQLEPVGSIVNSQRNNIPVSVYTVVPGKYSALGLNPVGPEGTCAFVESMLIVPIEKPSSPDGISKIGSNRTEIDHNVNGKGGNVLFNFLQQIFFPNSLGCLLWRYLLPAYTESVFGRNYCST
ncbi:B3 domain-containing protein [Dichanthelium oligosanthes]|uniref:B3 domain-containing protein n=1 Tax=Dichanthelium oligosanthes TaxID=888268 RepID=A0A1E5VNQ9_9POAL|nr:B3 domain-containing protein [Dichanthelium oligosanthes]